MNLTIHIAIIVGMYTLNIQEMCWSTRNHKGILTSKKTSKRFDLWRVRSIDLPNDGDTVPLNRRLEKHRTRCFTHEPGGSLLRKPFPQAGKKRISYIPIKHNQVWELDEHPLFSKKCATTKKEMDFNATIVGIGTGNFVLGWTSVPEDWSQKVTRAGKLIF